MTAAEMVARSALENVSGVYGVEQGEDLGCIPKITVTLAWWRFFTFHRIAERVRSQTGPTFKIWRVRPRFVLFAPPTKRGLVKDSCVDCRAEIEGSPFYLLCSECDEARHEAHRRGKEQ